jgi:hypothetical protein
MGLFDGGESQASVFGNLDSSLGGLGGVAIDFSSDPNYINSSVDPIVATFGEEGITPGQPVIPAGSAGANVVVNPSSPDFLKTLSGLITGAGGFLAKLIPSSSTPSSQAGGQPVPKPTTSIFGSLGTQGSSLIPVVLIGLVVMVIVYGKKVFK